MKLRLLLLILLVSMSLSACGDGAALALVQPTTTVTTTLKPSATFTSSPTPTLTPTITSTPVTPTVTPTPWELDYFSDAGLYPGVTPVAYMDDPCTYLENRWGEGKSSPGTIIVPIMFHSIVQPGRVIKDNTSISMAYFESFMATARDLGFETITTEELVRFLHENQAIPKHTMVLILDDRKPGTAELFLPYLEANDWTLTLAYPSGDYIPQSEWDWMERLVATGRYDVQSHGFNHAYLQTQTPLDVVNEEILKPIEAIRDHFGTDIQSIIWPGGNFTRESIRVAREAGLELGYTVYSRGPVMFNWVPLGEPERAMDAPLMVLPRAWSTAADVALYQALTISAAAEQQAESVREQEQQYYELYCQSEESLQDAQD